MTYKNLPNPRIPSLQEQMLPRCCMDLDIKLIDLIFPEYLSLDGQEFIKAFGILNIPLVELTHNALDLGNDLVKIRYRCSKLQDDGSCSIYESRPKICKDFDCQQRTDCACKGQGFAKFQK